uniref:Uncharacterized protein n=1 Tax=Pithovirus LCPAC101 TaxID=2506586 RepID=A0A481Z4N6_9VIRU|nr:MAG: hypothetical protein LCPAC101_03030 [Pithovirus LCPAC101]
MDKFDCGCGEGGHGGEGGKGGHGDHHKSTVCCNAFNAAYGTTVDEGAQIILATIQAVVSGPNPPPPLSLKARIVMIRNLYVSYNILFQQAVLQAQKKGCGEGCCQGISIGLKGTTLGVLRLAVANALNPLFTLAEVADALNLSVEQLEGAFTTILRLSGCCFRVKRGTIQPIVAPVRPQSS